MLYRKHGRRCTGSQAEGVENAGAVNDPLMRMHATTRELLESAKLHAGRRASGVLLRRTSTQCSAATATLGDDEKDFSEDEDDDETSACATCRFHNQRATKRRPSARSHLDSRPASHQVIVVATSRSRRAHGRPGCVV